MFKLGYGCRSDFMGAGTEAKAPEANVTQD